MVVVPEFLIRRVYQKGSLKKTSDGVSFVLKNVLGPGVISGFNFIQINDTKFEAKDVRFIHEGRELTAKEITDTNPIAFRLGQSGTIIVTGKDCLIDGINKIVIEICNPEVGTAQLKAEDTYSN